MEYFSLYIKLVIFTPLTVSQSIFNNKLADLNLFVQYLMREIFMSDDSLEKIIHWIVNN
jgi:hypothetical protein